METRQPDEVGALGEEVIGALKVVRQTPVDSRLLGMPVVLAVLIVSVLTGLYNALVVPLLLSHFGGHPADWETTGAMVIWGTVLVAGSRKGRDKRTFVELRRGSGDGLVPVPPLQIWTADAFVRRALAPFFWFCAGVALLLFILNEGGRGGLVFPVIAMLFCFTAWGWQVKSVFHPLLQTDEEGVQVLTTKMLWSQIKRIEIDRTAHNEHDLWWQFFGSNGKRLASVVLSDNGGNGASQADVALVLARALNAKIQIVLPPSLASDSKASL
jgi:hypothetical protein